MKDVRRRFPLSKLPSESSDHQTDSVRLWKALSTLLFLFLLGLIIFGSINKKSSTDGLDDNSYVKQLENSLTKMEDAFNFYKQEEVPKISKESYDRGVSAGENMKNEVLENQIKNNKKVVQKYEDEIKQLDSKIDILESNLATYKRQERYLKTACKEIMNHSS